MLFKFSLKIICFFILFLFIVCITIFQRIYGNYHTIFQIIVGAIIGSLVAICTLYFAKQKLKGVIKEKKDDNSMLNIGHFL